jgi:GntR family transcriptional regulator
MAIVAYARIAEDLRAKIMSRDIKPGGQLPSEFELRDQYGASKNTVLDAIKKLKGEGLVETRPGQGWFARVRIVPFDNSLDWGDGAAVDEAKARGRTPQVTPPAVSLQTAPPEIANRLCVSAGAAMIVRRQEWFLDEVPWKLQVAWCPKTYFDQGAHRLLMAEDISEGLGAYLHGTLGLRSASSTFYLLPRRPNDEESRFFGFPAAGEVPYVIELIRTASMAGDDEPRPLYMVVGVYAGDRNRFEGSNLTLPAE